MSYFYRIYRNGKLIRSGYRFLKDDRALETFLLKMEQRFRIQEEDEVKIEYRGLP